LQEQHLHPEDHEGTPRENSQKIEELNHNYVAVRVADEAAFSILLPISRLQFQAGLFEAGDHSLARSFIQDIQRKMA
jgi:hypothetical protein